MQNGSVKVTATGSVTNPPVDKPVDENLTSNSDVPTTDDKQKQEQTSVPKSGPK